MGGGWRGGIAVLLLLVTGASCAGPGAAEPGGTRRLTVLAAASLTEPFSEIGAAFEAAHPGVRVDFSFAGSSQLAQQIRAGAPADVFAAASQATMRTVTDAGDAAGQPQVFARNQLVIAVPQGNPRGIRALDDLAVAGAKVALCAPQVPCGAATRQVLDNAGVNVTPVTLEKDVRAALSKLRLGEVDAALVYRSETVAAAAEVEAVEFAESDGAVNDYPIVVLAGAPNSADAQRFVAYVLSEPGRRILTTAGFQRP